MPCHTERFDHQHTHMERQKEIEGVKNIQLVRTLCVCNNDEVNSERSFVYKQYTSSIIASIPDRKHTRILPELKRESWFYEFNVKQHNTIIRAESLASFTHKQSQHISSSPSSSRAVDPYLTGRRFYIIYMYMYM